MTELRPHPGTPIRSDPGEASEELIVGSRPEYEISGLLRIAGIDLHLTDERQCSAADGPPPIQLDLFLGRIAGTVPQGIRHCCFDQAIPEHDSTRKLERRLENASVTRVVGLLEHCL
jgi:hypothetical protein